LGYRRIDTIEDCIGTGAFDPLRSAIGECTAAGFGELKAGAAFGALHAA
jgi:hypothetical protein